ncbi:MAG: Gfo/Idh/MocA family oxidoreductase [Cytophagales bacterium]|nr:Gfo/Idh/MocA family oxidoreductase [Armatimonadota bacterium]
MTERSGQKLRFGVIGCGAIGPTHAGAIAQIKDAELVAVADVNADRAREMAEKFGVGKVYSSDQDLLSDGEIDAVCLCTPSGMHADGAVAALLAGKHVIVEKPMEISLEACDRMIAAEDSTGKKLAIISQHRFDAATLLVKEAIDSGKLGSLVLADATVKWWRTQEYYDSGDWRGTWAMDGGGALMNQGVHTVDLLQWLAGGVSSLFAYTRTAAHERIEVEDIAVAALRFENGAVGTLTATTAAYEGFPVRIDLYGTEGTAVLEGDRLKTLKFKTGEEFHGEAAAAHALSVASGGTASVKNQAAVRLETNTAVADPGAVWGDAHRAQIEDFIAAIRTGGKPLIDGRAGKRPLEIILGAYRSSRTGQPVTIR